MQEKISSVTLVPIEKAALYMLLLQLESRTSNKLLTIPIASLDSILSSIYIGWRGGELILETNEFGIVNLPDFCSRLSELHSLKIASQKLVDITRQHIKS